MRAKLYLITHGETQLDREGRMHGQTVDAPLSQTGINTARRAAKQLAGKGIEKIFSSPLIRAKQTAAIIAQHIGATVETKNELLPWDIGRMGGAKVSSIKPVLDFFSSRPDRAVPNGEAKNSFLDRYRGFFRQVRKQGATVAIVAHSQHSLGLEHVMKGGDAAKVPVTGGTPGAITTISL